MKVFLIGLLGSGKSVIGKELAQLVNLPFIDLDTVIESQEKMKVSEIFSQKGEVHFRMIEASALREQSMQKEFIMATGGGTPCFHSNMNFINQTGTSVFLNTPIPDIVRRLKEEQQKKKRPLLANVPDDQLQPTLEAMFQSRLEFYNKADFRVNDSTVTAKEILTLITT